MVQVEQLMNLLVGLRKSSRRAQLICVLQSPYVQRQPSVMSHRAFNNRMEALEVIN